MTGRTAQMVRWCLAASLAVVLVGCFPPPKGSGGGGTSSSVSSSIPWEPELVTTESTVDLTCRAGSTIGVQTSTLAETYRIEAPVDVPEGETFDIVLRPLLYEVPYSQSGGAGVRKASNFMNAYRLPTGLAVESVVEEPSPGSSLVGYYVAPGADRSDPTVHQAVPGGTQVSFDPVTRTVATSLVGTGGLTSGAGEFRAGSAVQPPHIRITVTATAPAGDDLVVEVGGSLPADPNTLPWASPSVVRNFALTIGFGSPPYDYRFCAPFPGADIVLSTTTVIAA